MWDPMDNSRREDCERRYNELLSAVTDYRFSVKVRNGAPVGTIHSPSCIGVTGYAAEEYLANSFLWFEMIHEEDRRAVQEQIASVLAGQPTPVIEHRIYHKSGKIRWVQNTIVPRYDEHGRLVGYDGLVRDITDRKMAELQVRKTVREWINTFDSIDDFVSVHDRDYRIVRANKALVTFLNTSREDLVGRQCYEVLHGLSEPWDACPHRTALETGTTVIQEVVDRRIGFPLLVTCSPFYDEDGTLVGTVHIARNIAIQKQNEAEKERLIKELEAALAKVKVLSGFLPICSSCKKIRDDRGYWEQIEVYIRDRSEAEFTHGFCPDCAKKLCAEIPGPPPPEEKPEEK